MEREHYTILCVEDNSMNMTLMHHIFKKIPYVTLWEAVSAEEALDMVYKEQPDIILTDIQLPGMDGYEFLNILKSDHRNCNIPVIAVSSFAMESDIARGHEAGFSEYITKPIKLKSFLLVIDTVIGQLIKQTEY
ncbi:response regulator [Paenibacillus pini]|uniref:Response regulatory domain-containing protein n=1 Tax=Paenibacillus pini JCM 16418 TaxID=1236976 RepID=W7YCU0_9BACL|nr:response regulator [Paenibacillus pini]GAF06272.1 hypothetical protein JCM16418_222 [Paenibacillus pini JCM 16418]